MPNRPGRHKDFQYIGFSTYFLTICTENRQRAFDDLEFGRWAIDQLLKHATKREFAVGAYCLMPDHVHLLLRGRSATADLRSLILSWNTRTGYAWRNKTGEQLWQRGYYDHIVRDGENHVAVARYILLNPVKAGLAERPEDYALCGSCEHSIAEILAVADEWHP